MVKVEKNASSQATEVLIDLAQHVGANGLQVEAPFSGKYQHLSAACFLTVQQEERSITSYSTKGKLSPSKSYSSVSAAIASSPVEQTGKSGHLNENKFQTGGQQTQCCNSRNEL